MKKKSGKAKKTTGAPSCPPGPMREERGASVREISNGFVVSEYKSGPKGYTSTETFHKTKPVIETSVKGKG